MSKRPQPVRRRPSSIPVQSVEPLESRQMFSADPIALPAAALQAATPQAAALQAAGFEPIEWNGQTAYALPGKWVVRVDGVSGSARKQFDAF
jgi:hypothetical protein